MKQTLFPAADTSAESQLSYPGWRVLLAAFFGVMTGYSVVVPYTFSLFLKPLSLAFGWQRDQISFAFGCVALTVALCAPLIGRLLDRYGSRRILLPCTAIFGMAFGSLAFLSGRLWHFYLVFLLMGLAGNGTTQLGYSRPVATWFTARRGMALSWIAAGAGLGAMTLPLIAAALLSRNGWRFAYAFLGALVLVVSLPLTALFVCESSSGGAANAFEPSVRRLTAHSMRAKPFLLLIAAIFLYSVTFSALLSHLSAILTDRGMSLRSSAQVLSILGGCSFVGRVSIGFILDRASATRISFVLFVTTVFGVFLLSDAGTAGAFLGVSLIGLAAGGESDITPYLLSRYFGLRNLSTLYGFAWTAFAAGAATGAVLMGKLYATTGSYRPGGIRWFAIPTAISALLMAVMPRYPSSGGDSHTTETQQSKMLDRT